MKNLISQRREDAKRNKTFDFIAIKFQVSKCDKS